MRPALAILVMLTLAGPAHALREGDAMGIATLMQAKGGRTVYRLEPPYREEAWYGDARRLHSCVVVSGGADETVARTCDASSDRVYDEQTYTDAPRLLYAMGYDVRRKARVERVELRREARGWSVVVWPDVGPVVVETHRTARAAARVMRRLRHGWVWVVLRYGVEVE